MNKSKFVNPTPAYIKSENKFFGRMQSKDELADILLRLKKNEYVLVNDSCKIIPREFNGSSRFKKFGDYKKLITFPREEAIERKLRPQDSLDTKLAKYSGEERGYGFVGNRNRTLRLVPLVVAYDGLELFLNADKEIEVQEYARNARFKVPSRTTEQHYKGNLLTIPFGNTQSLDRAKQKYADWIDLAYSCSCDDEAFMGSLNTVRVNPEIRACAHSVAAYKKLKMQNLSRKTPVSIDPFAFPTKLAHDVVQKMRNNVVKVYENDLHKNVYRNLLIGEQELLLSTLVSKIGFKQLFYFDNSTRGIQSCKYYMK